MAALLGTALTAQAQTTPTNDQLLDELIASAAPGATTVVCGDMILSLADLEDYRDSMRADRSTTSAFTRGSFKTKYWPNGVVPYAFDSSLSSSDRDSFLFACANWQRVAQLTFVPRTNQTDYIRVLSSSINLSEVGRQGGRQDLKLAPFQGQWVAAHEIAHSLGVLHEHQRSDRNNFISIQNSNLESGHDRDLMILSDSNNRTSYDFESIMHYSRDAYPKNFNDTLIAKPDYYERFQELMGNSVISGPLSSGDIQGMASIYGAPNPTKFRLSGSVRTNTSQNLSGVTINLQSTTSSMPAPVTTDASGAYSFPDLLPGTYTIRAEKNGYSFNTNPRSISITNSAVISDFVATLTPVVDLPRLFVGFQRMREGNSSTTATPGNSFVTINISMDKPSTQTVTVKYATADATAQSGSDYIGASGTLSFAPGVTSFAFKVKTLPDTVVEGTEVLHLNISDPIGATIADSQGGATIFNDDTAGVPAGTPELYVSDPIVTEGDSGNSFVSVNVGLSAPSTQTVRVNYATASAAAVSGSDFNGISGILSFPPGVTSMVINVPILTDKSDESNENFQLNLSNAVGATIADGQGNPVLNNDDSTTGANSLTSPESSTSPDVTEPSAPYARNAGEGEVRVARSRLTRNGSHLFELTR